MPTDPAAERTRPSEADEIEGTAADIVEHFDGVDVAALTDIERDALTLARAYLALSTPPLPSAEPRDLSGYCVACGQEAGPHNTYGDAEGRHALNVYPNFSVCDSCLPSSDDTAPLTNEMEPEEAALRCWHNDFTNRCIPFEEIAEQLMRWTALRTTPPLPSAEPVAQEAVWFRWLRDNPQAAAALVALVAQTRPFGPDLGAMMESGEVVGVSEDAKNPEYRYTTPPAAAQDTGPKDEAVRWLAILLAGEYDTEWQDAEGVPLPDLSQPCRHLLDAARAAGGE